MDGTVKTVFKIPAGNLALLQGRIADLAKRADKVAKKGALLDYTPIGLTVGEKIVEKLTHEVTGLPLPPRIYFLCTVTGATPKLAGWTFIATLQHEEGGTILRTVPTANVTEGTLKPYRNATPACDHCKAKRRRNDTFVVRHDDGTVKQVGRNCLADFTGCKSPQAVASLAEFLAAAAGVAEDCESWDESSGPPVEDIGAYLAYVACAIRTNGWISRTKAREQGKPATANDAWAWMHPAKPHHHVACSEADRKLAKEALAWTDVHLSEADPDRLSDYEHNLRVAVAGGIVTFRLAGIVASLISYYERAIGKEILAKTAINAGHVGTVGKRETFTLALAQVFSFETQFGVQHIHKFVSAQGAIVVWKTTSDKLDLGTYEIKGTVKAHDDYKGIPQTVLTRCKPTKIEKAA